MNRVILGLGIAVTLLAAYFTASAVAQTINECIATGGDGRSLCWVTPATPTPTASPTSTPTPTPTPAPTATPSPTPTASPTPSPTPPPPGYAKVPCFDIFGQSNRVYENLEIGPCASSTDFGIDIQGSTNITIRNVIIHDVRHGINALSSSGIRVDGNVRITNIRGPWDNGSKGSCVQFDKVVSGTMRGITCVAGSVGTPGDLLSAYQSADILIEGNDVSGGTHPAGCGIIVDGSGDRIWIRDNVVSEMVNCGIGIAVGTNILVDGNRLIDRNGNGHACNPTSFGDNSCLYVWKQYPPPCDNIQILNNFVQDPRPFWDGQNCTRVTVSGNSWQ